MAKYRKKPVVVEAVQWTGKNRDEVVAFAHRAILHYWREFQPDEILEIDTPEGVMAAFPDDYIIKGVNGEFYPCKPDIFEKTYERVEDDA